MNAKGTFIIDESIGNNIEIELSYKLDDYADASFFITFNDNNIFEAKIYGEETLAIFTPFDEALEVMFFKVYDRNIYQSREQ